MWTNLTPASTLRIQKWVLRLYRREESPERMSRCLHTDTGYSRGPEGSRNQTYSRLSCVHIGWNKAFFKILKNPSIEQKNKLPHMKAFSLFIMQNSLRVTQ